MKEAKQDEVCHIRAAQPAEEDIKTLASAREMPKTINFLPFRTIKLQTSIHPFYSALQTFSVPHPSVFP